MWSGQTVISYRSQLHRQIDRRIWSRDDREEQLELKGTVRGEINKLEEELHGRSKEGWRHPFFSYSLGPNERT